MIYRFSMVVGLGRPIQYHPLNIWALSVTWRCFESTYRFLGLLIILFAALLNLILDLERQRILILLFRSSQVRGKDCTDVFVSGYY